MERFADRAAGGLIERYADRAARGQIERFADRAAGGLMERYAYRAAGGIIERFADRAARWPYRVFFLVYVYSERGKFYADWDFCKAKTMGADRRRFIEWSRVTSGRPSKNHLFRFQITSRIRVSPNHQSIIPLYRINLTTLSHKIKIT